MWRFYDGSAGTRIVSQVNGGRPTKHSRRVETNGELVVTQEWEDSHQKVSTAHRHAPYGFRRPTQPLRGQPALTPALPRLTLW